MLLSSLTKLNSRLNKIPLNPFEYLPIEFVQIGIAIGIISLFFSIATKKSLFNPRLFLIPFILIALSIVSLFLMLEEYRNAIRPLTYHTVYINWDLYAQKLDINKSKEGLELDFLWGDIDIAYLDSIEGIQIAPEVDSPVFAEDEMSDSDTTRYFKCDDGQKIDYNKKVNNGYCDCPNCEDEKSDSDTTRYFKCDDGQEIDYNKKVNNGYCDCPNCEDEPK
jgi:hypothetical protein